MIYNGLGPLARGGRLERVTYRIGPISPTAKKVRDNNFEILIPKSCQPGPCLSRASSLRRMALSFAKAHVPGRSHHANHHGPHICRFELRLDSDFVVFRGSPTETGPVSVKGRVVVMTSDVLQVKGISVTLVGRQRVSHLFSSAHDRHSGPPGANPIVNKSVPLYREIKLTDEHAQPIKTIPAGNTELNFDFELPGDQCESIEGLRDHFMTYDLKAVADRGVWAKDLVAAKHLRVIRTLSPDVDEGIDPQQVSGVWPDKIKYDFATASKAVAFGSTLTTDISLIPLLDKLKIGKIKFSIREVRKIKTRPGPELIDGSWQGAWKEEQTVWTQSKDIPEDCQGIDPDLQLPRYRFEAKFNLPRRLTQCRQSVEDEGDIRIRHFAHYDVALHNPDGHVSELRVHHSLRLFISPLTPINDDNSIPDDAFSQSNGVDPSMYSALRDPPPMYGSHNMDMLYDNISPSGFLSPSASGAQTPFLSSSMDDHRPEFAPTALHSRLQSLHASHEREGTGNYRSGTASPYPEDQGAMHYSENTSANHSTNPSRQGSYSTAAVQGSSQAGTHLPSRHGPGSGIASPNSASWDALSDLGGSDGLRRGVQQMNMLDQHYDMDELKRMPSYDTAVRSAARVPYSLELPTYDVATSRPPSPESRL